jgi:hypothetical protein
MELWRPAKLVKFYHFGAIFPSNTIVSTAKGAQDLVCDTWHMVHNSYCDL